MGSSPPFSTPTNANRSGSPLRQCCGNQSNPQNITELIRNMNIGWQDCPAPKHDVTFGRSRNEIKNWAQLGVLDPSIVGPWVSRNISVALQIGFQDLSGIRSQLLGILGAEMRKGLSEPDNCFEISWMSCTPYMDFLLDFILLVWHSHGLNQFGETLPNKVSVDSLL